MKLLITGLLMLVTSTAFAGNHANYLGKTDFKTGPEVTKKCLECHSDAAKDIMMTSHWNWAKKQVNVGKTIEHGKKNGLNPFCLTLNSNFPRCTSCHIGYGWKDKNFDFAKQENVDCLICHDTTGTYKKFPTGAGHPAYKDEKFMGKDFKAVDLNLVAKSVGKPGRANCLSCHANAGGGDRVKHGDISMSLKKPSPELDVHMGKLGFVCQTCHTTNKHDIKGEALLVTSGGSKTRTMGCQDCHSGNVHKSAALNRHMAKVACQTCHIPEFARDKATKTSWDWSQAGKDIKPNHNADGDEDYSKMKGTFTWEKNVKPAYYWWNGISEKVLLTDTIDPSKPVTVVRLKGDKNDGKIYPFKLFKGKQPYDTEYNRFVVVNTFGPEGYWKIYNWEKAVNNGMKAAGLDYSGKFGFVETRTPMSLNHTVAPKEKALTCLNCHGKTAKRLDWKSLGYNKDPMVSK